VDTASLSSESSERIDYLQYSGIFFWWKTGVAYGDSLHEFETAEACFCKAEEYVGPSKESRHTSPTMHARHQKRWLYDDNGSVEASAGGGARTTPARRGRLSASGGSCCSACGWTR
jgi:hypothetical protein